MNTFFQKMDQIKILLIVSLGFNVFFMTGFLVAKHRLSKLRSPSGRVELLSRRMHLDKEQIDQVKRLKAKILLESAPFRLRRWENLQALSAEISKQNPDPANIKTIVSRSLFLRTEQQERIAEYINDFINILDYQQRKKLGRKILDNRFFAN